jgi:hypothetical protein
MGSWQLKSGKIGDPRGRGTSAIRNRYQAKASENLEGFMCAVVTMIF